jgi:regulator of protease activity HflC (stomatin/prohibitin superfamily)
MIITVHCNTPLLSRFPAVELCCWSVYGVVIFCDIIQPRIQLTALVEDILHSSVGRMELRRLLFKRKLPLQSLLNRCRDEVTSW